MCSSEYRQHKTFQWDGVDYYLQNRERRLRASGQVLERLSAAYQRAHGTRAGSILDVGCAIGLVLQQADSRGLTAVGIEPEARLTRYAGEQFGVDVRHGFLRGLALSGARFDLVYCEQVLEHVDGTVEVLKRLGFAIHGLVNVRAKGSVLKNHIAAWGWLISDFVPFTIEFAQQVFSDFADRGVG